MVPELIKKAVVPTVLAPIDSAVKAEDFIHIDLSVTNKKLAKLDLSDPEAMDGYIADYLKVKGGKVAFGGYKEKRNLYKSHSLFEKSATGPRNIHLGIDFWARAGTAVIAVLDGTVHSFKDNNSIGDYGPTIILKHRFSTIEFFTLYGHLSKSSLTDLYPGKPVKAGVTIGSLGTPEENVNYAPHLHFQCIIDLEGREGDYPGVCNSKDLEFYSKNCPIAMLLTKMV